MKEKIIKISVLLVMSLGLVTGCSCTKKEGTEKQEENKVIVNTEEEVIKDREVDGIKMTNTSYTTVNGITTILTSVTNDSSEDYYLKEYVIIIKDEKGEKLARIPGYVGTTIKAGETRTINSSTNYDVANAKSIEYEVVK